MSDALGVSNIGQSRQIAWVSEWNRVRGWGFSEQDFEIAAYCAPNHPDLKGTILALVPYLTGDDGVLRTYRELSICISLGDQLAAVYPTLSQHSRCLRLIDGLAHPADMVGRPVLRWERISFDTNVGKSPRSLRGPAISPHAGILAAIALHKEWAGQIGSDFPALWLPGYMFDVRDRGRFSYAPIVRKGIYRNISLDQEDSDYGIEHAAVPEFFGEPIIVPAVSGA